jgi:ABC-type branched-subunit amino acid transport system substrate-binding protein
MPVTGRAAQPGSEFLNGAQIGINEVNANGGVLGQKLVPYVGDTGSDAVDAVTAFRQLALHSPAVIIGSTSIEEPSIKPLVDAQGIPQIANLPGALYDGLTDPLIYRNGVPDSATAKAMALYAIQKGWTKCSLVFENVQSAQSYVQPIISAYKAAGGTVLDNVMLVPSESSYRTEITTLFAKSPQCVFIQTSPQTSGTWFTDARQLGHFDEPWIGTDQFADVQIFKAAGLADAGKWVTGMAGALPSGPTFTHFSAAYQAKFSSVPAYFAAIFYDSVIVTALAMTDAKSADPKVWYKYIGDVTGDETATEVTSYAQGVQLLKQGKKIDYEGASGNLDFNNFHTIYTDQDVIAFSPSGSLQTLATIKATALTG